MQKYPKSDQVWCWLFWAVHIRFGEISHYNYLAPRAHQANPYSINTNIMTWIIHTNFGLTQLKPHLTQFTPFRNSGGCAMFKKRKSHRFMAIPYGMKYFLTRASHRIIRVFKQKMPLRLNPALRWLISMRVYTKCASNQKSYNFIQVANICSSMHSTLQHIYTYMYYIRITISRRHFHRNSLARKIRRIEGVPRTFCYVPPTA